MQRVLDAPVSADVAGQAPHLRGQAADEVGGFVAELTADLALPIDHDHALQAGPGRSQVGRCLETVVLAALPSLAIERHVPPRLAEVAFAVSCEQALHRGMQRGLIALDRQDVVGAAATDRGRGLLLTMQGVERDHGALQFQQVQQFHGGRNLVALVVDRHVPQRQPQPARPGADQVQSRPALGRVEAAAERLAVQGHVLAGQRTLEAGHPILQAAQELARVESREHPAEGVVRGEAVLQPQEAAEPFPLLAAETGHVDPTLRPADRRAQGDDDHVHQQVPAGIAAARVAHSLEVCKKFNRLQTRHARTSLRKVLSPSVSTDRLTSRPTPQGLPPFGHLRLPWYTLAPSFVDVLERRAWEVDEAWDFDTLVRTYIDRIEQESIEASEEKE